MSGNRLDPQIYDGEFPSAERFNELLDAGINSAVGRFADVINNYGARRGFTSEVEVTPESPASLKVDVAPFEGYDAAGLHFRKATALQALNCALDYLGASTIPSSGHRLISIFVFSKWTYLDPVDVDGTVVYQYRQESYEIKIYSGTAVSDESLMAPPARPGNACRLCDIHLQEGQTQIVAADIRYYGYHQDRLGAAILESGGAFFRPATGPSGGTLMECRSGQTQFGSIADPISDDAFLTHFVPAELKSQACAAAYLNHGFLSSNVFILKKINIRGTGVYIANYIDLSDLCYDFSPTASLSGALWTFHVHDGAENYTGQTGLLAIGSSAFAANMIGRNIKWMAVMKMIQAGV